MRIISKCLLAGALLFLCTVIANAATLLPNGKQQFLSANGTPLAGGFVYFYIPGTSTPKDTYQDAGQTILNTNPVTLDAAGEAIIYGAGAYRQVVTDSVSNQIWDQLTADTSGSGTVWAGTSTGSANAQAVTAASYSPANGALLYFRPGFTNTGAMTLNVNGTGGIAVYLDALSGPRLLTGGEIVASTVVGVTYDSSLGAYHILNPSAQRPLNSLDVLALPEIATPAAPAASNLAVYGKSSDVLAFQSPGGVESTIAPGGSSLALAAASGTLTLKSGGSNLILGGPTTSQTFTSGSGTYTPTAGTVRIHVRMCGGGGGSGGAASSGATSGGTGGTTSLGAWTAIGGGGGAAQNGGGQGAGGAGGTGGVNGTGSVVSRNGGIGGQTQASVFNPATTIPVLGFGGYNQASAAQGTNGVGYGTGGGITMVGTSHSGPGGGAEYVEFWQSSPSAVSYAVGAAGTAGGAGVGTAGATGSGGLLVIEEFPF